MRLQESRRGKGVSCFCVRSHFTYKLTQGPSFCFFARAKAYDNFRGSPSICPLSFTKKIPQLVKLYLNTWGHINTIELITVPYKTSIFSKENHESLRNCYIKIRICTEQ